MTIGRFSRLLASMAAMKALAAAVDALAEPLSQLSPYFLTE